MRRRRRRRRKRREIAVPNLYLNIRLVRRGSNFTPNDDVSRLNTPPYSTCQMRVVRSPVPDVPTKSY